MLNKLQIGITILVLFIWNESYADKEYLKVGITETVVDGTYLVPGDTVKIDAGTRDYILFRNITGAQGNPVVIINEGGQVNIATTHFYAIKFQTCKFIKMTGTGASSDAYGFKISQNTNNYGTGLTIDNLSSDFEVEFLEIGNVNVAGIYAKTDPYYDENCNIPASRENFTMYNLSIHDCYLHDIGDEGMYIGSSKYTIGYHLSSEACGVSEGVLPHVIEGVSVYNNIVENTGWDGIQVSSATKDCFIYNNVIRGDSYKEATGQMSGILIGGGSNCDCYNNKIFDGKGDGIDILGLGNHKIFNNLIVNAGKTFKPSGGATSDPKHGLWVGHVSTVENAELLIYNNTIVSPKTHGMKLTNVSISSYKIYNNIISEPGSANLLGEDNQTAYLNISNLISYQLSNNLLTNNETEVQFIDVNSENYDLEAQSPAVNTALDVSGYNLTTDIEGKSRPYAGAYDIGAYESHENGIGIYEDLGLLHSKIKLEKVSPSPTLNAAKIRYELKESIHIKLFIMTLDGRIIKNLINHKQLPSKYSIDIEKDMLPHGFYFVILDSKFGRLCEKFIII